MNKHFPLTSLLLLVLALVCAAADYAVAKPAMGINFDGAADWSTELPFANVFMESRRWISQREGAGWGNGPELALDSQGWIRRLESGCYAETPLCTIEGGHYPSGIYTVRYRGKGKLTFNNAKVVDEKPGEFKIQVDSQHGAFWVQIRETDPADYIRDIQVYLPGLDKPSGPSGRRGQSFASKQAGFEDTHLQSGTDLVGQPSGPWNPAFLARWKGVDTVRYMDLMHTNGSKLEKWSDRPQLGDATFTEKGVPIELLCDLANRLNANPWFCVPHRADDEFVRNMARTIKKNLNPNLKVYVEYSNEVWNGQFEQCRYAQEKGKALLPDESPWVCGWAWTSHRARQIFQIFEKEFGGTDRLVRVLASQAANSYVSEQLLKYSDVSKFTDALAIAPYFGNCVTNEHADEFIRGGLSGALDQLEKQALPEAIEWMKKQKELADQYGIDLVCYEAGQHLVGIWGANDRDELNAICLEANASERMGKLYDAYFKAWEDVGGGLMCHFSSTGMWSKWGSWGLFRWADEKTEDSPKYQAFERALKRWSKTEK